MLLSWVPLPGNLCAPPPHQGLLFQGATVLHPHYGFFHPYLNINEPFFPIRSCIYHLLPHHKPNPTDYKLRNEVLPCLVHFQGPVKGEGIAESSHSVALDGNQWKKHCRNSLIQVDLETVICKVKEWRENHAEPSQDRMDFPSILWPKH